MKKNHFRSRCSADYDIVVKNGFCVFRVGLKTQPESKCPELLANYCDMLLRKTPLSKKLTSEEIEAKLKEVVSIYIFMLLYKQCMFA